MNLGPFDSAAPSSPVVTQAKILQLCVHEVLTSLSGRADLPRNRSKLITHNKGTAHRGLIWKHDSETINEHS